MPRIKFETGVEQHLSFSFWDNLWPPARKMSPPCTKKTVCFFFFLNLRDRGIKSSPFFFLKKKKYACSCWKLLAWNKTTPLLFHSQQVFCNTQSCRPTDCTVGRLCWTDEQLWLNLFWGKKKKKVLKQLINRRLRSVWGKSKWGQIGDCWNVSPFHPQSWTQQAGTCEWSQD